MSEKSAATLKHYKWLHRMTQEQLAKHFDVSRTSINGYLHGAPIHGKIKKKMIKISKGELNWDDLA